MLLLVLAGSTGLLALKESLAVFVKLESGDDTVGRVNGELRLLSIDLLSGHLVNIDAPSSAVNAHDLTLTIGVSSADNFNAITLADGDGLASVLGAEVLGEVSGKQFSTLGGTGTEMGLSSFTSLAGNTYSQTKTMIIFEKRDLLAWVFILYISY